MNIRDRLHADAARTGIPLRTLADVKADLTHDRAKGEGTDIAMARLMLRHGRLTEEARNYVARYLETV